MSGLRKARLGVIINTSVVETQLGRQMLTSRYIQASMLAKSAMWRLRHPVLTSEHLFYACLRVNSQHHWNLCEDLPVTAEAVWSHLKESPPWSERSEEFYKRATRCLGQSGA
jgi:hypothetical protein